MSPFRIHPSPLSVRRPLVAVLVAVLSAPLCAESATAPDVAEELDRITVVASLTERALAELPASVTIIDRERMEETLARDIKDLVRYEPGVSVAAAFGRFGLSGFRIRGLEGNRVRIEIDGVSIPDAFSIGSFSSANRNFVALDTLKQADIVRGPASSLYGSDALGGVVAFTTKDPEDYVRGDAGSHVDVRSGYDSLDHSAFLAGTGAFVSGDWSGLLSVSGERGEERRNQGDNDGEGAERTRANAQDTRGTAALVKVVRRLGADSRLRLTAEHVADRADTDVLSGRTLITGFGPPVQVLDLKGEDRQRRARFLIGFEHDGLGRAWADQLRASLYWQQAETVQDTFEQRASLVQGQLGPVTRRERRFDFDQRVLGAELTAFRGFQVGTADHTLAWGMELERSDFEQQRDGRAFLPDGSVTNVIVPDTFPVRDFPLSRTDVLAAFVQDEIEIGRWRLVPGVRIDRFRLSAGDDPLFAARNPGIVPTDSDETSVSPKFGLVFRASETLSLFAGYARGFRAPPYNDVNLGFTNLQFGYTALPNPDLKPETSDGLEAGVRMRGANGYLVVSAFLNRYDDFIQSLRSLGVDPDSGLLVFQSQNIDRAEIRGAELKAGLDLGQALGWDGWQLRGAAAWQRGRNRDSGAPLASVDPLNGGLGLAWEGEQAGVELASRLARAQSRLPAAAGGAEAFHAPGYAVFDLLLRFDPTPAVRIHAGIFNLADRRYFDAADLPLLAADSPILDRFTSPGRTAAASLRLRW